MIWVSLALIASVSLNVLIAVLYARQSERSSQLLDRAHERTTEYTNDLVEKLMAQDWVTYKAYETEPPEEEEETIQLQVVTGPDKGGFGSRLGIAAYRPPLDEEEDIEALESEVP